VHLACAGCGRKTIKAVKSFNGIKKGAGCRKCSALDRAQKSGILTAPGYGVRALTVTQINELRPDMSEKLVRALVKAGKTAEEIVAYKSQRGANLKGGVKGGVNG
jgi:hypothetical protein